MKIILFQAIFLGYLYLTLMTLIFFYNTKYIDALLMNSLIYFIISFILFFIFLKMREKRFSYACIITFSRMIINIIIFSLILFYEEISLGYLIVVLALISLFLDGLDGYLSKLFNESSKFGSVFDMETDTLLMLVLSLSLYMNFNSHIFILIIPFYRYLFVFMQKKITFLSKDLSESFLRKFICATVTLMLILCHIPGTTINIITYTINFAIFLITFSFARDIIWLYKNKNNGNI